MAARRRRPRKMAPRAAITFAVEEFVKNATKNATATGCNGVWRQFNFFSRFCERFGFYGRRVVKVDVFFLSRKKSKLAFCTALISIDDPIGHIWMYQPFRRRWQSPKVNGYMEMSPARWWHVWVCKRDVYAPTGGILNEGARGGGMMSEVKSDLRKL